MGKQVPCFCQTMRPIWSIWWEENTNLLIASIKTSIGIQCQWNNISMFYSNTLKMHLIGIKHLRHADITSWTLAITCLLLKLISYYFQESIYWGGACGRKHWKCTIQGTAFGELQSTEWNDSLKSSPYFAHPNVQSCPPLYTRTAPSFFQLGTLYLLYSEEDPRVHVSNIARRRLYSYTIGI